NGLTNALANLKTGADSISNTRNYLCSRYDSLINLLNHVSIQTACGLQHFLSLRVDHYFIGLNLVITDSSSTMSSVIYFSSVIMYLSFRRDLTSSGEECPAFTSGFLFS